MAREEKKERDIWINKQKKRYYVIYKKEKNTHYKSSDDERQKKIAIQAEQVNTKRNNTNNLTAYGQKMINDSNIINMIPKNKDIRAA